MCCKSREDLQTVTPADYVSYLNLYVYLSDAYVHSSQQAARPMYHVADASGTTWVVCMLYHNAYFAVHVDMLKGGIGSG
jgi:hypothetical protein